MINFQKKCRGKFFAEGSLCQDCPLRVLLKQTLKTKGVFYHKLLGVYSQKSDIFSIWAVFFMSIENIYNLRLKSMPLKPVQSGLMFLPKPITLKISPISCGLSNF